MPDTSLQDTRQKWSSNDTMQQKSLSRPWYATAGGGVYTHRTVSVRSPSRRLSQLAFTRSVYSFEVNEDTDPGRTVLLFKAHSESIPKDSI